MSKTKTPHTIFERMGSYRDQRVRWHIVSEVEAPSRPEALRTFVKEDWATEKVSDTHVIDSRTDCVSVEDYTGTPCMILAVRTDRVDFTHYDAKGNLVEVTA